jgi:hypothetical protein
MSRVPTMIAMLSLLGLASGRRTNFNPPGVFKVGPSQHVKANAHTGAMPLSISHNLGRDVVMQATATAAEVKAALDSLESVGEVDVTRSGPARSGEYRWTVTFISSAGGDHVVGPTGGDVPLLFANAEQVTGTAAAVYVNESLKGVLALTGKGQQIEVAERTEGTRRDEVQVIQTSVETVKQEVQAVTTTNQLAYSQDKLAGNFSLLFCDFDTALSGTVRVTQYSQFVIANASDMVVTGQNLRRGDQIKIGTECFQVSDNMSLPFNDTHVPLTSAFRGASRTGLTITVCSLHRTAPLVHDISASNLKIELEKLPCIGTVNVSRAEEI